MKTTLKSSIIALIVSLSNSCFFAAGSYPYAELYEFDSTFDKLKMQIQEFKALNPQYEVIQINEKEEYYNPDGYSNDSIWAGFYFYFSDIGASVLSVVNVYNIPSTEKSVILRLVGLTYSPNFGEWKRFNTKDMSKEDNANIKKKFETEILDHLGIEWKHKK